MNKREREIIQEYADSIGYKPKEPIPPKVGDSIGWEEDAICKRDGCTGEMVIAQDVCFCDEYNAPCSSCEYSWLECSKCDFSSEGL